MIVAENKIREITRPFQGRVPVRGIVPITLQSARAIMGHNYVPTFKSDSGEHGFHPNSVFLREIMTPKGRLIKEDEPVASRNTHVLMLIPQGSIIGLQDWVLSCYQTPIFANQDWYDEEKFAKHSGRAGWHLIRKELLKVGVMPDWNHQRNSLPVDEETPSTRVMVQFLIRYYLATGLRLYPDAYARCSTSDSIDQRGKVGYFGREGLHLGQGRVCKMDCGGNIGLAAAKKQ